MFEKRASGKAVLVVDVDDSSVGLSIVELSEGPAAIITAERTPLPMEVRTGDQSAAAILQLLEQATTAFLKAHPNPVTAIHVILRAPWTKFRTSEASQSFEAPHTITKDLIPELAKKALAAQSELDRSNIIEAGVMHVALNGYPTSKPIGKKAKSITVVAFEGDANAEIKNGIATIFGKQLPERPITYRTGMRALLTVLHEHIPDIHRYVIFDIGGNISSCAVVRKEAVTQFATIPEGSVSIVRKVSGNGIPEETMTNLRLLAMDTCSTDACKAIKESLARAEPELAKTYGEMLATLAARRRIPNQAMLSAPADMMPWLQGFFERIDFSQFTATTQPLEVEALTVEHLRESVTWKAGSAHDSGIATAAGCVNILEQSA